ncbi:MAG: DUF4124 domain-containing protein [Steroidobacteraceae bacterium]
MQSGYRWFFAFLALAALGLGADATAAIYICTAADGSRVYSDERCGSDAKVVPGVTSKKRPSAKSPTPAQPASRKSAAELDALLEECDTGKVAACNEWTRSGGPNRLREKERQAQVACDAGSLAACEERYCADGAGPQCRTRVLKVAKFTGETWYLREERKLAHDATGYAVRCIWEGVRATRDVSVTCGAQAGPQRCSAAGSEKSFAQWAAAASDSCARR